MRKGEWPEASKVSGVECVGIVDACPGKEYTIGAQVAGFMGGLGRTLNGSYAEYTQVPVNNVLPLESELPWSQLAALPISYCTAHTFLFRNLKIQVGQTLLIRGATSALGQASLNLAVAAGVHVIGTTRKKERFNQLLQMGAKRVELERAELSKYLPDTKQIDCVLDLIGNSTIVDSMNIDHRGGYVCLGGWLGGLAPIPALNPLLEMASGVYMTLFASPVWGEPQFEVSDNPLQAIAKQVESKMFNAEPNKVFQFNQIRDAQQYLEANPTAGKVVVVVDDTRT